MRSASDGGSVAEYQTCSIAVGATPESRNKAARKMIIFLITMSSSQSLMMHVQISEYVSGNALTVTVMFLGSLEAISVKLAQYWIGEARTCEAEIEIFVILRSFIVAQLENVEGRNITPKILVLADGARSTRAIRWHSFLDNPSRQPALLAKRTIFAVMLVCWPVLCLAVFATVLCCIIQICQG
jgi:hypothetical protein